MQFRNDSNELFKLAASFIHYTGRHVFLTGKAGTGKTTFLKSIVKSVKKKAVVVAPTGVAAINAGGVTMHSFFQLPLGAYLPVSISAWERDDAPACDKKALLKNLRMNSIKRKAIEELELLIIDEISMARADMIDAMDAIMRYVRRRPEEPFGGVQLLMIGDLYQLPPVTVNSEWSWLSQYYDTPFFFDARALKEDPPICIELQKIYRQSDPAFINLLNRVRNNIVADADLEWLNNFYNPDFKPNPEDGYITLVSHNNIADRINRTALEALNGKKHEFKAEVEGLFNDKAYPADQTLQLKEGAQIMFIRNDKGEDRKYYNGKIGIVKKVNYEGITISFSGEESEFLLEKEQWENIRYRFNEENKQIEGETMGSFKQYPIRLAWAVTIHKSQGLTFDKAIIDAGASFTAGQVYVALSRLTGVSGLVLRSRIRKESILCDNEVIRFMSGVKKEGELAGLLEEDQKEFVCKILLRSFEWVRLTNQIRLFIEEYKEKASPMTMEALLNGGVWLEKASEQEEVAGKFIIELKRILHAREAGHSRLEERVRAACGYFSNKLQSELVEPIEKHLSTLNKAGKKTKKYLKSVTAIHERVNEMKLQLDHALALAEGLHMGTDALRILKKIEEEKEAMNAKAQSEPLEIKAKKVKKVKGETRLITLNLFREGKSITDIALERGLSVRTIGGHLAELVLTGEAYIYEFITGEKINQILPLAEPGEKQSLSQIKHQLGNDCDYYEIQAVINHTIWIQEKESIEKKQIPSE